MTLVSMCVCRGRCGQHAATAPPRSPLPLPARRARRARAPSAPPPLPHVGPGRRLPRGQRVGYRRGHARRGAGRPGARRPHILVASMRPAGASARRRPGRAGRPRRVWRAPRVSRRPPTAHAATASGGSVDRATVASLLTSAGLSVDAPPLDAAFAAFDADRDGRLDATEFVGLAAFLKAARAAFAAFGPQGGGGGGGGSGGVVTLTLDQCASPWLGRSGREGGGGDASTPIPMSQSFTRRRRAGSAACVGARGAHPRPVVPRASAPAAHTRARPPAPLRRPHCMLASLRSRPPRPPPPRRAGRPASAAPRARAGALLAAAALPPSGPCCDVSFVRVALHPTAATPRPALLSRLALAALATTAACACDGFGALLAAYAGAASLAASATAASAARAGSTRVAATAVGVVAAAAVGLAKIRAQASSFSPPIIIDYALARHPGARVAVALPARAARAALALLPAANVVVAVARIVLSCMVGVVTVQWALRGVRVFPGGRCGAHADAEWGAALALGKVSLPPPPTTSIALLPPVTSSDDSELAAARARVDALVAARSRTAARLLVARRGGRWSPRRRPGRCPRHDSAPARRAAARAPPRSASAAAVAAAEGRVCEAEEELERMRGGGLREGAWRGRACK